MFEEITIFHILRAVIFWLNPLIFIEGLLLLILTAEKYINFEKKLSKEIISIKTKIMPALDTNIDTFYKWMLARKNIVGLFCIIYSVVIFLTFKKQF